MTQNLNYRFVTSNTKLNNVLTANDILNANLIEVQKKRKQLGLKNNLPTLADISTTHIMYFHKTFKPFVQITNDYIKIPIHSSVNLGTKDITFSLPEIGNFYKDIVIHIKVNNDEYDNGILIGKNILEFKSGLENSNKPKYRFCSYPGERIINNIRLDIGGSIIDKYNSEEMNINRLLFVDKNDSFIYNQLMGQENVLEGWVDSCDYSGNIVKSSDVSGNYLISPNHIYREKKKMYSGYQTPKMLHDPLELWIPLQFWFNLDTNIPLPVNATVKGSRNILFDLADLREIIGIIPRGIYKQQTYNSTTGLITDSSNYDYTDLDNVGATINNPNVFMEAYINCLVIQTEIADLYIKRVGFHLIRVYKKESIKMKGDINKQLSIFKHPIECFYIGAKKLEYFHIDTSTNYISKNITNWHKFTNVDLYRFEDKCHITDKYILLGDFTAINPANGVVTLGTTIDFSGNLSIYDTVKLVPYINPDSGFNSPAISVGYGPNTLTIINGIADTSGNLYKVDKVGQEIIIEQNKTIIKSLSITTHGFNVVENKNSLFFNSYIPYTYPSFKNGLLYDKGIHIINFALYPGIYNPSGHINVTRSREFYLNVISKNLDNQTETHNLFIIARAINFLLLDLKNTNIRIT